jgi:hypothetical protein
MFRYLAYVVRRPLSPSRRAAVGTAALAACAAALVGASTASAGIQQEFKAFSDCPLNAPELQLCVVSRVTSGEFVIGSKTVPINKTVTLQGGLSKTGQLIPAADGNTLSRTPLQLPGGLVGVEVLPPLTEVTATAELAGTATINVNNTFAGEGTAVSLPVVVKLDNPALGNACYIGTASEPLALNLTTGTTSPPAPNQPITGSPGQLSTPFAILRLTGVSLVDNAFAAPGVNGCGGVLSLVVDPAVDLDAGLPAAAGHNTAVMNGEVETAEPKNVRLEATLPELGRCDKVPFERIEGERVYRGRFKESKCTTEDTGKLSAFEWYPGAEAKKFTGSTGTGSAGVVTFEGHSGAKVTCKKGTSSGEYNGNKALTMTLKLTGCSMGSATEKCQSAGAAAGEIVTGALSGGLGFIQDDLNTEIGFITKVGVALTGQPSLLSAACGAAKTPVTVTGAVIGQLSPIDLMTKTFTLAFTQSGGAQSPEQFDGEPKQTLSLKSGNAGAEAAGLAAGLKVKNEEKLALKGEI